MTEHQLQAKPNLYEWELNRKVPPCRSLVRRRPLQNNTAAFKAWEKHPGRGLTSPAATHTRFGGAASWICAIAPTEPQQQLKPPITIKGLTRMCLSCLSLPAQHTHILPSSAVDQKGAGNRGCVQPDKAHPSLPSRDWGSPPSFMLFKTL